MNSIQRSSVVQWLGAPKPDEPLRILYGCTQRPGYGGASTETYEAIKALRKRGHHVTGLFVDESRDCDPDQIGDIRAPGTAKALDPAILSGRWHLIVGKMWQMGLLVSRQNVPSVFITSGCIPEYVNTPYHQAAFEAASHVICHSTLDLQMYRKAFPQALYAKILPEVVRTSALAARGIQGRKPLRARRWDVCFSASDWSRPEKGGPTMVRLCRSLQGSGRIVVAGRPRFGLLGRPGIDVTGVVPHARMLEVMADSRVVVIPSSYDSSPNVYVEAAMAGCNIVVSPAVGNVEGHPPELCAAEPSEAALLPCITRAVRLDQQLCYQHETPDGAADRLEFWLRRVATGEVHDSTD